MIIGFNGAGKSILLKTLVGQIPSLKETFTFSEQTITGFFSQDFDWREPEKLPVQIVSDRYPTLTPRM